MTRLRVADSPKMLRETLCLAQSVVGRWPADDLRKPEHVARLARLIDECDRHRPIGPDGKHGNRHTRTCGCPDRPGPARRFIRWVARGLTALEPEPRLDVGGPGAAAGPTGDGPGGRAED